jgi:hypothetical protein
MLFKNSVRTSKRTPHFTITKINWLMLFKEIIFFLESYKAHKNKMQNYWLFKQMVHIVTTNSLNRPVYAGIPYQNSFFFLNFIQNSSICTITLYLYPFSWRYILVLLLRSIILALVNFHFEHWLPLCMYVWSFLFCLTTLSVLHKWYFMK